MCNLSVRSTCSTQSSLSFSIVLLQVGAKLCLQTSSVFVSFVCRCVLLAILSVCWVRKLGTPGSSAFPRRLRGKCRRARRLAAAASYNQATIGEEAVELTVAELDPEDTDGIEDGDAGAGSRGRE